MRSVMAASAAAGSIKAVVGSTSTSTGVAPAKYTPSAVAQNVLAGMMTSSPGPMPAAISMSWMAEVPDATPRTRSTPRYSASCRSKAATSGPDV